MAEIENFRVQIERIQTLLPIVESNNNLTQEAASSINLLAKIADKLSTRSDENEDLSIMYDTLKAILDFHTRLLPHLKSVSEYSTKELSIYNEMAATLRSQGIID